MAGRTGQEYNLRKRRKGVVGSKDFIEMITKKFGALAKGRKIVGENDSFQLREPLESYNVLLVPKKEHIGPNNAHF